MKPKIFFISDDIRHKTGVANMARSIVQQTKDDIEWILGAGSRYNKEGNVITEFEGMKMYQFERGFGDPYRIKKIIEEEVPDGVLFFTDPRYFQEHYKMEYELRQHIPYMFYTIWDNYPSPKYNLPFYESTDGLFCISKQTKYIVENLVGNNPDKVIKYVPHGVDPEVFKFEEDEQKIADFFKKLVQGNTKDWFDYEFIVLWNNKNIGRKRPADIMYAFNEFAQKLDDPSKVCLIMHTNPRHAQGQDLYVVRDDIIHNSTNIFFSGNGTIPDKEMYLLYNMADVTVCNSDAEGFGLSNLESIMCQTPIISTVTGGIQDQMGFEDEWSHKSEQEIYKSRNFTIQDNVSGINHGLWSYPLFPESSNLIGSTVTPYIFEDRVSMKQLEQRIWEAYEDRQNHKLIEFGAEGRNWVMKNGFLEKDMAEGIKEGIIQTIKTFKPQKPISIVKF